MSEHYRNERELRCRPDCAVSRDAILMPVEKIDDKRVYQLNELHLNLLGKVFFASVGAWLLGRLTNLRVRGTQEEVDAVANAMMSSRRFQDELQRPGASVESVIQKLGLKHASAREFERILGIPWPL
jgi:hypothetical protein